MTDVAVKHVVAYAQTLRQKAATAQAANPWARPYNPSDAVARKLCQRAGSPAAALTELARRAMIADAEARAAEELAHRARERHLRRLRIADERLRQERSRMSYGKRIDDALIKLALISGVPASVLDSDHVSGGEVSQGMAPDDPMPRAQTTARLAAEAIEAELDRARRVSLAPVEPDRDARLLKLVRVDKLTPEQISIADPSQGSASRVRRRLQELGE